MNEQMHSTYEYIYVHISIRTNKQLNCMDEEENKLKLESKRQGLNQLHQMEEQLSAIESTAKLVENELKASNKVKNKYSY